MKFLTLANYITYTADKLREHGIGQWRVRWAHRGSIRTCGRAIYAGKVVELNKDYFFLTPEHDVCLDTCLHEVAHALNYERSGTTGHTPLWKSVCREIGAKPERLNHDAVMPTQQTKGIATNRAQFTIY